MARSVKSPAPLRGQRWKRTQQATIDGVLGPNVRTVRSFGTQFYNKDNWTARAFVSSFCEWARLNPDSDPTRADVVEWVVLSNRFSVPDYEKGIVIAATPDELTKLAALALVGGGYHEAWHTEYSRRTPLHIDEVWPKIRDLWRLVEVDPKTGRRGWAGLTGPLLTWSNVIEDIRIERCGCKKYPGSPPKMNALQDLILKMEEEGRSASEHRGLDINDDLSAVMGTFRDVGLGYTSPRQKLALRGYRVRSPGGYAFVMEGPLRPLLDRSIALGPADDLDSLWLAMEVVGAVVKSSKPKPAPAPPPPSKGGKGPPPPAGQQEASSPPAEGEGEGQPQDASKPKLYKKGDRAVLQSGPHKGCEVEVTRAGLPDADGVQALSFSLVEPD